MTGATLGADCGSGVQLQDIKRAASPTAATVVKSRHSARDVRADRTSRVNSQTMTTNMKSIIQVPFLSDLYGFLAIQTQMPLPGRLDCSGLPGHHLLTDLVRLSNQHPFARFSALNLDAQERQDGGGLHS